MQTFVAFMLGIIANFVTFGLVVTLLSLVDVDTKSNKLTTLLLSSGIAFEIGGFSQGVITREIV